MYYNNCTEYITEKWVNSLSNEWKRYYLWRYKSNINIYKSIYLQHNINTFMLDGNKRLKDLTGLKYAIKLEELHIKDQNITSLKGIENCFNLRVLNIVNNNLNYEDIKTYYPLMNCYKLYQIEVNKEVKKLEHKLKMLLPNLKVILYSYKY